MRPTITLGSPFETTALCATVAHRGGLSEEPPLRIAASRLTHLLCRLLVLVAMLVPAALSGACTLLVELTDYSNHNSNNQDATTPMDGGCTPDATMLCYTGPSGTDQGDCHGGTRACSGAGEWGDCVGEVTPAMQCAGRECGPDGCEGTCGECEYGVECADATGLCQRDAMVSILGGTFSMGSPLTESGRQLDEGASGPSTIQIDDFQIDRTEVTNQAYLQCVLDATCLSPDECDSGVPVWFSAIGFPDEVAHHPVVCVTWEMARDYCAWVGKRLCTEAEWERACIDDNQGTIDHHVYPWGDTWPGDINHYANCAQGHCYDSYEGTSPVGYFYATHGQGATPGTLIVDLAGNVAEWVLDWYDDDFYGTDPVNPKGPCDGDPVCGGLWTRVYRGGGYNGDRFGIRCSRRSQSIHDSQMPDLGFRCCKDAW